MSLLTELLTYKSAASFLESTKIGQKQGIKSSEKRYNVRQAFIDD